VLLLFAGGFLVRLINLPSVYVEGTFYLPVVDGMYHLRVVELMLTGNWSWPFMDPWLAYPTGAIPYWPPGFDAVLSLLSLPIYMATGNMDRVMVWLGWVMPVAGALAPVLIYVGLRRVLPSGKAALLGGIAAVLEWGMIRPGQLGSIDHHGLELLLMAWIVYLLITPDSRRGDRWLGLVLGMLTFLFPGSLLFPMLVSICFGFHLLVTEEEPTLTRWRRISGWALVSAIPTVLLTGHLWTIPVSSVYPGLFHLLVYLVNWLIPLSLFLMKEQGLSYRRGLLILLTVIAVIVAGTGGELADILLRREPNAMVVGESVPLLTFYRPAHFLFRPLYWMAPVVLVWTGWRSFKYREPLALFLFPLLAATLSLALLQVRFEPLFAATGVAASVLILYAIFQRAEGVRFGKPLLLGLAVFMMGIQVAFLCGGWIFYHDMTGTPRFVRLDKAMAAVRNMTDPEGDVLDLSASPPWGVLAPRWHQGHHILYRGRRAVVATPFGGVEPFTGRIADALDALTAKDESELLAVCRRVNARYLLLQATTEEAFARYVMAANAVRVQQHRPEIWMDASESWINRVCSDEAETSALELVWREPVREGLPDAQRLRLYEVHQVYPLTEMVPE